MAGDHRGQPLLPQGSDMQGYSFATPNTGPRENQKNYVFVDEHNRHKRLKVMRACEGCRRRKIKCDAATTNTWPCSACVRLKLQCVPPTMSYDKDFLEEDDQIQGSSVLALPGEAEYPQNMAYQPQLGARSISESHLENQMPYEDPQQVYQVPTYTDPAPMPGQLPYGSMQRPQMGASHSAVPIVTVQQSQPMMPQQMTDQWKRQERHQKQETDQDIADAMGFLRIDSVGVAPYIYKQKKGFSETPTVPENDTNLPPLAIGPDNRARIPDSIMPPDSRALQFFDVFFREIHPYVPVLNRLRFYRQWQTDRDAISPLILEAMFSCAASMMGDRDEGYRWTSLAGKHADSFMDVPRLSTLQAMLILMKARESAPKSGYYYRSWTTIETLTSMARDLGLDEHYELHLEGEPCDSTSEECLTKTRVWQTLFILEMMIGGPQGRFDMRIPISSIDLSIPQLAPDIDEAEVHISRNFVNFVKLIRNMRLLNDIYAPIRKRKDWALDPKVSQLNKTFAAWIAELQPDLQVVYPADGSPPWIPSHFIDNLHSYYHLSILMLHRPQALAWTETTDPEENGKKHMIICYNSAKSLCRLQEAVIQGFGLPGLLYMQRGINFVLYSVLTCTVLHLVALTSPHPELYTDAKDYFTRHMRILERCSSSWPMPEIQAQIQSLREAFSADLSRPFELKSSFPYGSPGTVQSSPQQDLSYQTTPPLSEQHLDQSCQSGYSSYPITPPISAGNLDLKADLSGVQSMGMMQGGRREGQPMQESLGLPEYNWNPSRIFDQWNTAFGPTIPAQQASPPQMTSASTSSQTGAYYPDTQLQQAYGAMSVPQTPAQMQGPTMAPTSYPAPAPSFVSPSMWRASVASVYEDGLKRRWDFTGEPSQPTMMPPMQKRQRARLDPLGCLKEIFPGHHRVVVPGTSAHIQQWPMLRLLRPVRIRADKQGPSEEGPECGDVTGGACSPGLIGASDRRRGGGLPAVQARHPILHWSLDGRWKGREGKGDQASHSGVKRRMTKQESSRTARPVHVLGDEETRRQHKVTAAAVAARDLYGKLAWPEGWAGLTSR